MAETKPKKQDPRDVALRGLMSFPQPPVDGVLIPAPVARPTPVAAPLGEYSRQMGNVGGFFVDLAGDALKSVVGYPGQAGSQGYGLSRLVGPATATPVAQTPTPVAVKATPAQAKATPAQSPVTPAVTPAAPSRSSRGGGASAKPKAATAAATPPATTGMDDAALQSLVAAGNAQVLPGGLIALGGLQGGTPGTYAAPWVSAATPGVRAGDVEVIKGSEASYLTPELGMSNPLSPAMYFGSLKAGGNMEDAATLQRMGLVSSMSPQSIGAEAQVQSAGINAAAGIQQAAIDAAARRDVAKIQVEAPTKQGQVVYKEVPADPRNPTLGNMRVPAGVYTMDKGMPRLVEFTNASTGGYEPDVVYEDSVTKQRRKYQADGTWKEVK